MKKTIRVHRDEAGVWQPAKYVNAQTKIKLDRDRRGVPQPSGTIRIRVTEPTLQEAA